MHAIFSILCHYGTRYSKCGSYRCQYCRCKIPQKLYQPCFVLLSHFSTDFHWLIFKFIITEFLGTDYHCFLFLSTDYHRFTQIFLISKDIVIITDFLFGTEIHGFFLIKARLGSQALEGRHNLAQGVSPVCMTSPSPSPSTRQWRVEGEEGNEANWDRAHALSYVMSPFQGLRCTQQIKPYPSRSPAVSFLKAVFIRA